MKNVKPEAIYIEDRSGNSFYGLLNKAECITYNESQKRINIGFVSQKSLRLSHGCKYPNALYNPSGDIVYVELHYADGKIEAPYERGHIDFANLYQKILGKS